MEPFSTLLAASVAGATTTTALAYVMVRRRFGAVWPARRVAAGSERGASPYRRGAVLVDRPGAPPLLVRAAAIVAMLQLGALVPYGLALLAQVRTLADPHWRLGTSYAWATADIALAATGAVLSMASFAAGACLLRRRGTRFAIVVAACVIAHGVALCTRIAPDGVAYTHAAAWLLAAGLLGAAGFSLERERHRRNPDDANVAASRMVASS